jgi:hypothetical protein
MEERAENYGVEVDGLQVVGQQSALHSHHVPPKETNLLPVYLPAYLPVFLSTISEFSGRKPFSSISVSGTFYPLPPNWGRFDL